MTTRIKLRRDTAANWEANNPILALGEPGLDTTNNQVKYGDGETTWNLLDYASSSNANTTQSVFALLTSDYDFTVSKSTNGTNWTSSNSFVNTSQQNLQYENYFTEGWGPNLIDMAVGNGRVVYIDWSPWFDIYGIWTASNLETYPVPVAAIEIVIPEFVSPIAVWENVYYLGNSFIVTGYAYDDGAENPSLPIFAYSTNGTTWTQGSVNYSYVSGIYTTQSNLNTAVIGLHFTTVGYNGTGWLFNLDNLYDGFPLGGEGAPGGFYVTGLSTTLSSSNFDETPSYTVTGEGSSQGILWTGSRWVIVDQMSVWQGPGSHSRIWYNTSSNPRLGTWIDIDIAALALEKFGYDYSDEWEVNANPVLALTTHNINGTQWTVLGLGDGQLLSTTDFSTWYSAVPEPVTYTINEFFNNSGTSTDISLNWATDQRQIYFTGKATITGGTSAIPAGTYYISDVNPNTFRLYTDVDQTVNVDSSGWGAYTSGDSTITFSRGYRAITALIAENSTIVSGNDDGFVHATTTGNLSGTFTRVKDGNGNRIRRLVYGAVTNLGTSWEQTNTVTGDVNTAYLSEYGFRALATDNNSRSRIHLDASGWELATWLPLDPSYPNGIASDAYAGIYSTDWINDGTGPNADIAISLPDGYHAFDRYGNVILGGSIIRDRVFSYNNPPVDNTVTSLNYQTTAELLKALWDGDPNQTAVGQGWAGLIHIDSDTFNSSSLHHYYLPPGGNNGREIIIVGEGTNIANVCIWVQAGKAGVNSFTDNYWLPFRVWNTGGYSTRSIAKAIWLYDAWHFDNDAWAD